MRPFKTTLRMSRRCPILHFLIAPTRYKKHCHFIDGVRYRNLKSSTNGEIKRLEAGLVHAMKFEVAQQATRRYRHAIRGADVQNQSDPDNANLAKTQEKYCCKIWKQGETQQGE
ncbi:hypothetical protein AVEN_273533-1 [Araneus ventricosus]|uniref:Uncharacterized protein n=1 Tax=Araneus ventricosus TaxID=182803 RepID=A0A4Y2H5L7_ARAVE|nr:hypothetical protein AVEN_273533-1 [Araneus ventricosus]